MCFNGPMPRFKDQAICIRDLDWSETSQLVVLLTASRGKVRGLAKGSKRQSPSSVARFSGGIELLTAGQVIATTRPSSELAAITEWDLQRDYFALRRDLRAQRRAMYAADLVNAMLADEDPHPRVHGYMLELLEALCRPREDRTPAEVEDEAQRALLVFQWGLLADCGYRPELGRDVRRGGELTTQATYSFDPLAGGVTADKGLADWRVRAATVAALRHVAAGEELASETRRDDDQDVATTVDAAAPAPKAASRHAETASTHSADATRPPGADVERANRLLCVYLRALLDKELPTMGVVLAAGR